MKQLVYNSQESYRGETLPEPLDSSSSLGKVEISVAFPSEILTSGGKLDVKSLGLYSMLTLCGTGLSDIVVLRHVTFSPTLNS